MSKEILSLVPGNTACFSISALNLIYFNRFFNIKYTEKYLFKLLLNCSPQIL